MKNISEMLEVGEIALDVEVENFDACLEKLIGNLMDRNLLSGELGRKLDQALISREKLEVTSIGRGVVIPHAYLKGFPGELVCFARLKEAIEHNAPDGQPIDLVFMMTGPEEAQKQHLQTLARIVRLIHDPKLLSDLRKAASAEEVLEAIKEVERRHA